MLQYSTSHYQFKFLIRDMLKLPIDIQQISGPAIVLITALLVNWFDPQSYQLLAFYRDGISEFEWWRLLTANLVHTNFNHLLLNAAGLLLLWALHGFYYSTLSFLSVFILCSLGTTLAIYFLDPNLIWYAGLSGSLHGVFVWGAYWDICKGLKSGWLLLAGLWLKIGYEQISGPDENIAVLIDSKVAIDAHLFGALTGSLIVLGLWGVKCSRNKKAR